MSKPYTALTVANWFLAWTEGDEEAKISILKLQKLLYYAQGTMLAKTGQRLFTDPIEAWAHGPVVSSVYHHFKGAGSSPLVADESFAWSDVDNDTSSVLASVWNTYGGFSAWKLREMTHHEVPWKNTFDADVRSNEIDPALIQEYFAGLFAANGHKVAGR